MSCIKHALQVGGAIAQNDDVIRIQKKIDFYVLPEQITRNPVACSHDCSGKSIHQDVKNKTIEDCSLTNTSTILNIPRASLLGFPFASTASFDSTSFPGLASTKPRLFPAVPPAAVELQPWTRAWRTLISL